MKEKQQLRKLLLSLDNPIKEFSKSLTPGNYHFIGIKLPLLKEVAKSYPNKKAILDDPFFYYAEEILIYIYMLSYVKVNKETKLKYLDKWVSLTNHSWYTTDSGIKSCKFIKKDLDFFFSYFTSKLTSTKEYEVRIAVVALFSFYLNDDFITRVIDNLLKVTLDTYYVKMSLAWAYQTIYSFYNKDLILDLLKSKKLSKEINNLTIKKIRESRRTTPLEKALLLTLKQD